MARRALTLLLRTAEAAALAAAVIVVSVAIVGRLASDAVPSLQKLAWIPMPASIAAAAIALAAMAMAQWLRGRVSGAAPASDRRSRRAVAIGAALLVLLGVDHLRLRWGFGRSCPDAVRLVHWNATSPGERISEQASSALEALDPEILVVSNDGWLFGRPFTRHWKSTGRVVHRAGPFALVTDFPVREARLVLASDRRWAGFFRIEIPGSPRGELAVLAVDLPSATDLPRREVAAKLRSDLAAIGLPEADLVVGDFNMDAGSASLAAAFPRHRAAFELVGEGYAGSYPRALPLWLPDQVLVGDAVAACGHRLIDLGFGTHRAQEFRFRPAPTAAE